MKNVNLNVEAAIKYKTGLSLNEIRNLSLDGERKLVKKKTRKELSYGTSRDFRKIGRGNPLLARKRYRTISYINSRIDELK